MVEQRKLFQYCGLFAVLVVIYSVYLKSLIEGPDGEEIALSTLLWGSAKVGFVSGLPFGAIAFFDSAWRSKDAAPVALAAWAAVYVFYAHKYGGGCPWSAALLFIPLSFGAVIANSIGAFRHSPDSGDKP